MNGPAIRRLLAPVHAAVLELVDSGHDAAEIAALLDIDVRAVAPLARIARAKLRQLEMLEQPESVPLRSPSGDDR